MKPIKLERVHIADGVGVHDPALDGPPRLDSRKDVYSHPKYELTLVDSTVVIRCDGKETLVPWSRCTECVPLRSGGGK